MVAVLILTVLFCLKADVEVGTTDEVERTSKSTELERRVVTTGLCQTMQQLVSDYILLEDFFMSSNIRRALDQHQTEMAAQQVSSSTVGIRKLDTQLPETSYCNTFLCSLFEW